MAGTARRLAEDQVRPEGELVARARGRDEAAIRELVRRNNQRLFRVARAVLRDDAEAEDVVQETYVKIWGSAGRFDASVASPITWMATIARNRAIDLVRKRGEASIEEEPEAMDIAADVPNPLAAREMTEDLQRLMACLGRLDAERKELVLLAYYNGLSREQLAARLAKPVNTIKTWLRRSLMKLRECLSA